MALNPNILLSQRAPDVGKTFSSILNNIQGIDNIKENRKNAPIKNELLQAQTSEAQASAEETRQTNRITSISKGALELMPVIDGGNVDQVRSALYARSRQLEADGLPANDTQEAIDMLDQEGGLEQLKGITQNAIDVGRQFGVLEAPNKGQTSSQRDFLEFQRLSAIAEESGSPEDAAAANQFGQKANISRMTPQELSTLAVDEERLKAEAKAGVEFKTAGKIEGIKAASKAAIARSEKAFDSIEKIKTNVNNIDEAITLIDQGANTGTVYSKLPSVRSASIALDNLQGRLGLDVLSTTTFGALSENELAFALNTALPKNLSPPDLREWLIKKKDTQLKLSGYLGRVATFLGTPGNTVKDFIEIEKVRELNKESSETGQAPTDLGNLSIEELMKLREGAQ